MDIVKEYHPKEVKAFQDAIADGTKFALANVEASRAIIGKYSKLPPEVTRILNNAVAKAVNSPELRKRLELEGAVPVGKDGN